MAKKLQVRQILKALSNFSASYVKKDNFCHTIYSIKNSELPLTYAARGENV